MTYTFDSAGADEFAKLLFAIQADIGKLESVAISLQDAAINNKNRSRGSLVRAADRCAEVTKAKSILLRLTRLTDSR
jgi:hypothetical protein